MTDTGVKRGEGRNAWTFGVGTIGRDMLYTMVSMYLLVFYTEVIGLSDTTLAWVASAMMILRIFDACNDPIMGTVVDNTKSKYGKFKPWILLGAIVGGLLTILFFVDFGLKGASFVIVFVLISLLWDVAYTTNDIAYWSMIPALTNEQKQREKIGSIARICANVGLFAVVAGIVPITKALGEATGGGLKSGYLLLAIVVCVVMWIGTLVTIFGVKEKNNAVNIEKTSLKAMAQAIFKNDQLLVVAASMALFMIGYVTTTSFGLYYFTYVFKNEDMYSIFAVILGVGQLIALAIFPLVSKKLNRRKIYILAIALVVLGYLGFFFSPTHIVPIGISAFLMFFGQAFIQLLMLVFLADTVEYGEWKLKKRNESVSFSIQPFINKVSGAIANGIVGFTLIISGINRANSPDEVTAQGIFIMKSFMMLLPLVFIAIGFVIYFFKFKIDKSLYDRIIKELDTQKIQADVLDKQEEDI